MELAKLMDVPKEEVVFALDAILDPVSLFEPVFHDGTDTVCVMDQSGDTKNTDDNWAGRYCSAGCYAQPERPRAPYHPASLLRGTHPDGGGTTKYTFRQTKGRKIPVLFLLYNRSGRKHEDSISKMV